MNKFILILILLIIITQYNQVNKINNSYDILQINNPKKELFEETINKKNICVFTNITSKLLSLKNLDIQNFKNSDLQSKKKLESILKNHFNYYLVPLTLSFNFNLVEENSHYKMSIRKQKVYRSLICQIKGSKRIILFSPEQKKLLYLKNNESIIDFWDPNVDFKKYPLFNYSKYIEVLLSPGQMLHIPYGWFYSYENKDDNIFIISNSESIFSYFLKN